MRVTPLDIIQKKFSSIRKGLDPQEVRKFLDEVCQSMEDLLMENQALREEVAQRDADLAEFRNNEADIKETLLLARRISDDLERGARRESDVIVGEARIEAQRILMAVADERRDLQADIVRLRSERERMIIDLRSSMETFTRLLEDLEREAPAAR
ncbi:MAG: DivIVA domain-containing protein [Myxococcota bacterium]|jgi:cell division initiation protein|nr:DivIVA domain-containing protein [Myxococcota bacterium]